jgi:CubicO group peptidase (beta-lactamase class C family)
LAREGIVGLGVGIIRSQDIVYLKGFGLEDREEVIDVDPEETLFRWASVSKGITGLASVIALHTGALSLDADIRDLDDDFRPPTHYLPSRCDEMSCAVALAPSEQVLSPRRLLSHTAGIQHYTNGLANPVPPNELTSDPAHNSGFAWALEYWVSSPLIAKPGVAFSYSTFGSNLAGAALEAAVGVSFADYVDEHIAQVIGMRTLRPDYHWEQSPRRAAGYYRDGRITRRDSDTDVSWKLPGGGFRSSVGDLARYCGALMGSVVLPEDLRDGELWAPVPPATHYALGFGVSDDIVEHGGAQEKTRTYLRIRRNENVCLVLMTNSTWVDPEALAIEIDQALVL